MRLLDNMKTTVQNMSTSTLLARFKQAVTAGGVTQDDYCRVITTGRGEFYIGSRQDKHLANCKLFRLKPKQLQRVLRSRHDVKIFNDGVARLHRKITQRMNKEGYSDVVKRAKARYRSKVAKENARVNQSVDNKNRSQHARDKSRRARYETVTRKSFARLSDKDKQILARGYVSAWHGHCKSVNGKWVIDRAAPTAKQYERWYHERLDTVQPHDENRYCEKLIGVSARASTKHDAFEEMSVAGKKKQIGMTRVITKSGKQYVPTEMATYNLKRWRVRHGTDDNGNDFFYGEDDRGHYHAFSINKTFDNFANLRKTIKKLY